MDWVRKFVEPVDMTEGTPWKKIVLFAVPMLVGNIAQQLYNTVDSVVVGNYVGDNALAAVGSAGPILNLLSFLLGLVWGQVSWCPSILAPGKGKNYPQPLAIVLPLRG